MAVGGKDDLGSLASSFNDMAASLQEKLQELEELSKAQRQFVSDVSRVELRTPMTTIRMAAEILFEAQGEFDPVLGRSAELLQSQIERFETLLHRPARDQQARRERSHARCRTGRLSDLSPERGRRTAARRAPGLPDRVPAARRGHAWPRWTGAGWSGSCATCWSTRWSTERGATWSSPWRRTWARPPSPFATTVSGLPRGRSRWSSSGSGGRTRRARGRLGAPAWAWPSLSKMPGCTAAGCRRGGRRAAARSSGSPCPRTSGQPIVGSPLPWGPDEAEIVTSGADLPPSPGETRPPIARRTWLARARAALAALVALAAALAVAGCVSVPSAGPVLSYPLAQQTSGQNGQNLQVIAAGPGTTGRRARS